MVSKTIMVRKEVYDLLSASKRPDESFSEYFLRSHRKSGDIEEFFGMWADLPKGVLEAMLDDVEAGRRRAGKSRPKAVLG
ncbi:MAG TPA: antitoxin VapB family protein [Thermoplasmata archaeon]|nr:antitoxin VapB family protein [Thermoplasmata archaeon]